MKATIENLKINRNEVISVLTALFGESNLSKSAKVLSNKVEYAEMFDKNSTIEACIEAIDSDLFQNKKMKLADYIASLSDNNSSTYAFSWTIKNI